MAFTLPWTVNKLVSTNINDADSISGGSFGNVSLKVNGKTQLVGNTVIEGRVGIGKAVSGNYALDINGSINTTEINAPAIKLTDKNNLGVVKNITGATTLTFADGEYINLQNTTSYTVLLPLATASSIGARFVFFFSSTPLAGTKTIQRSGTQLIYTSDLGGGTVTSIAMSPSTDFCIELVCVGSSGTCWSMTRQGLNTGLVAYLGGPNVFTNLNTFQGGITASATQTINFGSNNPTMGGNNISNVVKIFGNESISGTKTFTTAIDALKITPTSRLELSNNKYISGTTTLNWGDAENIIFNAVGDFTVTLPSATGAGLSRVGARFTFAFASAFSGTKIVQVAGGNQYIYDGGLVLNTGAIALTRASQHYVELLCTNYTAGNICWSIVGKAYQYNIPSTMTFNSGISATAVQTITFGSNNPTMGGNNISGVVKSIGNESIAGIKTFTSPPVMDGGGITAASIPNNALQSTVALTNTPETITSLYTFTAGVNANTITGNTIYTQTPPNNSNNTIVPNTEYIYRIIRTDDTLNNISSGDQAGNLFTTGYSNLSFGGLSNSLMTTGFDNISLGYLASSAHNGYRNIAIGTASLSSGGSIYSPTNNVSIGFNALTNAQDCDGNFALGAQSLGACSSGSNNFMGGYFSGGALTTGNYNCGISYGALNTVTTGQRNNGIGVGCGGGITTGSYNTFIGDSTSATGDYSYCMALGAGVQCTANNQIKIGTSLETTYIDGSFVAQNIQAGNININGNIQVNSNNTLVPNTAYIYRMIRTDDTLNNISSGDQAGQLFTTGYSNLSFGGQANRLMTTGYDNISLGYLASTNHNGYRNIAIGTNTMSSSSVSTPTGCVAVGYSALPNATNCTNNVAIAPLSLNSCSTGSNNCMVGFLSGGSITTGEFNCGLSYQALNTVTTGQYNTGLGVNSGAGIVAGSFNTFLGNSTAATGDYSYSTALGAGATVTGNNQIKIGRAQETTYIDGSFIVQNVQAGNININGNIQVGTKYYPMLMSPGNINAATNWNTTPPAVYYGIQAFSITATTALTLPLSTSADVPDGLRIKFRRIGGTVTQVLNVIASTGDQVVATNAIGLTAAGTSATLVPASTYQAEIYLSKTRKIWYCML